MSIIRNPKERTRFLRFAVVGTIGAVVDFGTFNLLINFLNVPPIWANVISFATAVTSNFILNRYWTYPDSRTKKIHKQLAEFFVVNVVGLGIRTPIFAVLYKPIETFFTSLHLSLPIEPEFLGQNLALAFAVVVVMFWNFYVNRYWTYADVK